jgi:catechol 2,3-dioxygenase-like lactoylglutathione lyase family enzyme
MRLDHIAYRVRDRHVTAQFFIDAFGYKMQQEFQLDFGEGKFADCIALEPPEKKLPGVAWVVNDLQYVSYEGEKNMETIQEYHLSPEIFVSDGNPGSIVGDWVAARGGIGGIHHIAYQVDNVKLTMLHWQNKGYAEFSSEEPIKCPGLTQVFSKPSALTGVIYEFIKRDKFGFCKENVKSLMESTAGL